MSREKKSSFTQNQLFSGLIGAILSCIVTVCVSIWCGSSYVAREYIPIDNIDSLIEQYFVSNGLISDDILELDTNLQFEKISSILSDFQSEQNTYLNNLKEILVSNGIDVEAESLEEIYNIIGSISNEYVALSEEREKNKNQTMAEIMSTRLVVDGEEIDVDIPSSVAAIDGHYFYSESLLNSFLSEAISLDSSSATVYYGNERAEKSVFNSNMITDISNFDEYTVGDGNSFTMGANTYDNGFIENNTDESRFYANLKGEYSKISFVVGHLDGTKMEEATLYIYTKNGNEQYRLLKSFVLTPDMFPEEKTVDINYADGIQVVIEGSFWAKYALADIYLYR